MTDDRSLEEELELDRLLGRGEAQIAARGTQSTRGVKKIWFIVYTDSARQRALAIDHSVT